MAQHAQDLHCPDDEALEALAAGSPASSGIAAHVAQCGLCRDRLGAIRSDNSLIAEFRSVSLKPFIRSAPAVGGNVCDYRLLQEIGRGGQGVVFRALDERTGRTVALKMLTQGALATSYHRRRFDREIEIVAGLRHSGIVTLYEAVDTPDGGRAIAMEFVDGTPLDHWCEARRPGANGVLSREVLGVLIAVCEAVHYAHLHGVIHRDLKPSNIIVDGEGRPRVLDFGIARFDSDDAESTLTTGFVGSPGYAAPEQILGAPSEVDLRADLFALGAIAYQVLCGNLPFPGRGRVTELAGAVRDEPLPELPSRFCGTGSRVTARDLDAVLRKALAHEPERRYRSAQDLRDDLASLRDGDPVNARPDGLSYLLRRAVRRHRWAAAATLAVAVMLVSSTTAFAALWRGAENRSRYELSFDVVLHMLDTKNPDLDFEGHLKLPPQEAAQVSEASPQIERMIEVAGDDPVRDASMRHCWAHLLSTGLGKHKDALAHAKRAVELRKYDGEGDIPALSSLELVAVIQARMQRFEEAIETFTELSRRLNSANLPQDEAARLRERYATQIKMVRHAWGAEDAISPVNAALDLNQKGDPKAAAKKLLDADEILKAVQNSVPGGAPN